MIIGYAVLVGSPNFWFHVLGPAAIAVVVVFSLLVLADLSYPFSGDVAIDPEPFDTGALARFLAANPWRRAGHTRTRRAELEHDDSDGQAADVRRPRNVPSTTSPSPHDAEPDGRIPRQTQRSRRPTAPRQTPGDH